MTTENIRLFNRPMQEIRSKAWHRIDLVRKAELPVNTDHLYSQPAYRHIKTVGCEPYRLGEKHVWFAAATGALTTAELHLAWNVGVSVGRAFDALDDLLKSTKTKIEKASQ